MHVLSLIAVLVMEVAMATIPGLPPVPPQGSPSSAQILARLYSRSLDKINDDLARALKQTGGAIAADERGVLTGDNFRAARAASLKVSVERRLRELRASTAPLARKAAEESVQLGVRQGAEEVRRIGLRAPRGGVNFALGEFDERAVEIAARDMQARLDGAALDHATRAQRVFRAISGGPLFGRDNAVTEAIAGGIISGDYREVREQVRSLLNEATGGDAEDSYRKVGNRQIQVGGLTTNIRHYTEMLVITRTREATVASRHERLRTNGIGLVQITGRVSVNFCTRFLGMVFALDEASRVVDGRTYPLLSSLQRKGPPFHVQCSKGTAAFVPELVSPRRVQAFERANTSFEFALRNGTLYTDLTVREASRRAG